MRPGAARRGFKEIKIGSSFSYPASISLMSTSRGILNCVCVSTLLLSEFIFALTRIVPSLDTDDGVYVDIPGQII